VLLGYAAAVFFLLGVGRSGLPHVVAGLLAWLFVRFTPGSRAAPAPTGPAPSRLVSLGLLDETPEKEGDE
jgi:hypothetical protein